MLDPRGSLFGFLKNLALGPGDDDVGHRDRRAGAAGPVETRRLEGVERGTDGHLLIALGQRVDDASKDFLVDRLIDIGEIDRQRLVEDRPA